MQECLGTDMPDAFAFRPLARHDFALLSEWLGAPHVAVWWQEESDLGSIEVRYGPIVDRTDPSEVFIIERGSGPLGLIQRALEQFCDAIKRRRS